MAKDAIIAVGSRSRCRRLRRSIVIESLMA